MPSEPRNRRLLAYAREMRKNMTPEEGKLWCLYLRKHPKYRFRRQEIIGSYIADFYCPQAKLVIEIDGSQHFLEDAIAYDAARTAFFTQQDLRVLRFTNADINQRFPNVCETIEHHLPCLRSRQPTGFLRAKPLGGVQGQSPCASPT